MTAEVIGLPMESPFDRIRHEDEHGEHWYARELMVLMGYSTWERFAAVVEKAAESLRIVQGDEVVAGVFRKIAKNPTKHGGRPGEDYRLTRFAAYLVAMAGDDTKTQVAEARIYFAVRTREAEVAPIAPQRRIPQTFVAALRELASEVEAREAAESLVQQQQQELTTARPKAAFVDEFVVVPEDTMRIDDLAKAVGARVQTFRDWLVTRRVIYRRCVGRYWSRSKEKMVDEFEYRPASGYESWFTLRTQPEAPRLNNGQLRQTLYANPVGQVKISDLWKRHDPGDPEVA